MTSPMQNDRSNRFRPDSSVFKSLWRLLRSLPILIIAGLLASCGGGGGGGGTPAAVSPPSGLSYLDPGPLTVGVPVTITPTLGSGQVDEYTVSPALPQGLSIEPNSGIISGTPTDPALPATYTITATNVGGSSSFDLVLTVSPANRPEVSFAVASSSAAESSGSVSIDLTLSGLQVTDIAVDLQVGGTAQDSLDYTSIPPSIVIPAGTTAATIAVTLIDDLTSEEDETLVLTLVSPVGATLGTPETHTLTIVEDDPLPAASFASGALSTTESSGTVLVEVTLDRPSSTPVEVSATLAGSATPGVDFTALTTQTFTPGETTRSYEITLIEDALFEGDETIELSLVPGPGFTIGAIDTLLITLGEIDPPPTVEIFGGGITVSEDSGSVTLTISLNTISAVDAIISFTSGGTATAGNDFLAPTSPLTIPAGTLSVDFPIDLISDGEPEGPELLEVILTTAVGATLGLSTSASITIEDPSTVLPTVEIFGGATILEGSGPVNLTVTLSAASSTAVQVFFDLTGTASPGVDFAPPANPVTIPAGQLTTPITIEPIDEGILEGTETVIVTLTSANGATIGLSNTQTVVIDEVAPIVVELFGGGTVLEGGVPFDILISLDAPAPAPIDVSFSVGGTATEGSDYLLTGSPVTIPAGSTIGVITIETLVDAIAEGSETVIVTLLSAPGAVIGSLDSATVLITEASLPSVQILGGGIVISEGDPAVFMTIQLSTPSTSNVSVEFALAGSAQIGVDYSVSMSPIAISAGSTSAFIAVDPLTDAFAEVDETIELSLIGATGAILGTPSDATITIVDTSTGPMAPSGLSYSDPMAVYAPGRAIVPNVPSLTGGSATSYSVASSLPAGLNIDVSNGRITGIPIAEQPATSYTVTASNSVGQSSTVIEIEVRTAFEFEIPGVTVPYNTLTGAATFEVSLNIAEPASQTSSAAPSEIQGMSGGVNFSDQQLIAVDVFEGSGLVGLNGGMGADFYIATPIPGGGYTFGVIFSFQQTSTIIATSPTEWARIVFQTNPSFLAGNLNGDSVVLDWDGTLGIPPVENRVVFNQSQEQEPVLIDGVIQFTP